MNHHTFVKQSIFALIFLAVFPLSAANISINVEVLEPSCNINNGDVIEVDFGDDILSNKLNGSYYAQIVRLTFQCNTLTPDSGYLKIEGEEFEPGIQALKTSKENLSIYFSHSNNIIPINEKVAVNLKSTYNFLAILSKIGSKVQPGPFSASATLALYYE